MPMDKRHGTFAFTTGRTFLTSAFLQSPGWRNWQTHGTQNPAPSKGVSVRPRLRALCQAGKTTREERRERVQKGSERFIFVDTELDTKGVRKKVNRFEYFFTRNQKMS